MAQDLNNYSCTGRLTRDSEIKTTNSGTAICSFSIAVNQKKRQQDGTWTDIAMFFDCTLYGKQASALSQYLTKGQQVAINGSLEESKWTDKTTGQQRSKIGLKVSSVVLLGGSKNSGGTYNQQPRQNHQTNGYQQQRQPQTQQAPQPSSNPVGPEGFEDDIPF